LKVAPCPGSLPPALLDDAVTRGQAQSRALPLLLGGEERLEYVPLDRRRHADAGIAHGEPHVFAGHDLGIRKGALGVEHHVGGPEGEPPAGGHRVPRVDRQVDQDLLELPRIDVDRPEIIRRTLDDLDVVA
jgi:hypothetical protein